MITVLRWISFFTLIGLFVGVWVMAWVGFAILRKLDRDYGDRELLRAQLLAQSNMARQAVDAIDPSAVLHPKAP